MQSLAQLLSELSIVDPAVWIAISAALGVILVFLMLGRRPARVCNREVVPPAETAEEWAPPPVDRQDERRRSLRRAGLPTPLHIVDPKTRRRRPAEAYVLDRSTGGLRVAIEKPFSIGDRLQAKPMNAPDDYEWVNLVVRNCKETGDYFELGCQFDSELELNRLLMFG
jgi:hypothetical protein